MIPSKDLVLALATNGGSESRVEAVLFTTIVKQALAAVPASARE